jgi:hypothetical protein
MPKPEDSASIIEAEALYEMLLQAETPGGPKTPRGVMNVLLLAAAALLHDHSEAVLGTRVPLFEGMRRTKNVFEQYVVTVPSLREQRTWLDEQADGKPNRPPLAGWAVRQLHGWPVDPPASQT